MYILPVKEVEYHKVTFGDVSTPMQIAQEPIVLQENAPVSATDQANTNQPRRSQRVSHPPKAIYPRHGFCIADRWW